VLQGRRARTRSGRAPGTRRRAEQQGRAVSDVVIIDAGGANTGSVRYALRRLGVEATLSVDAATIRTARRVVLPGVGSARSVMRRLDELRLVDTIRSLRQPLLGICVGMQILFERSAEGDV